MLRNMEEQLSCVIRGLVQGVGFRWFVQREANARGITGWVRNNPEGSVELIAQGTRPALESFLGAVRKGPRSAMVKDVLVEWTVPSREYRSYEIR